MRRLKVKEIISMATHEGCWQGWGSGHGQHCQYKLDSASVCPGETEVPDKLSLVRSYPGWHKPHHGEQTLVQRRLVDAACIHHHICQEDHIWAFTASEKLINGIAGQSPDGAQPWPQLPTPLRGQSPGVGPALVKQKLWLVFQAARECPSKVRVLCSNHLNPLLDTKSPELGSSQGECGVRGAHGTLGPGTPEGNAAEEPAWTQLLPGRPSWLGEFILV